MNFIIVVSLLFILETARADNCTEAPGQVRNLIWEGQNGDVIISWDPPTDDDQCISFYYINITSRDGLLYANIINNTFVTLHTVVPCEYLDITVWAYSNSLQGEPVSIVALIPGIAPIAPVYVNSTVSSTRLELLWLVEPYEQNKCELYLGVFQCIAEPENNDLDLPGVVPNATSNVNLYHLDISDTFPVNVTNLSPFTNYTCSGFITNSAGQSPRTESVDLTTLEDNSDL